MRDRDRGLHRVEHWEELLTMGDPLAEAPTFATARGSPIVRSTRSRCTSR
jgi:hypothetical protein